MRKIWWVPGLCLLACAPAVMSAEKASEAQNAFRDSVASKQLVLRNFSGEDKVHAVWTGSELTMDTARWHTLAELEVNSVKLKHQTLVMSCSRHALVRSGDGGLGPLAIPTNIEIDVELGGADPADVLRDFLTNQYYGVPLFAAAIP